MEKDKVEAYRSQYVKLVKDSGEHMDGTIVEILDKDIIFQTELSRYAISMDSIREILSYEEMKKRRKQTNRIKF